MRRSWFPPPAIRRLARAGSPGARHGLDPRSERGFAILIVLWTLVLVSLIMAHVVALARQETDLASNLRNAAILSAEADGGVYGAIFHFLDRSPAHWPANGASHEINIPSGHLVINIRNESSKVDLNTAPPELIAALLQVTGLGRERAGLIAANIVAWRTPTGANTTADEAYRMAGYAYAPPHQPFESVGELASVLGVTPDIMQRVSPFLTVFHRGEVDPEGADPVVLEALKLVYGPAVDARLKRQAPGMTPFTPLGEYNAVLDIEVVATAATSRLTREAIVRVAPARSSQLYSILAWR